MDGVYTPAVHKWRSVYAAHPHTQPSSLRPLHFISETTPFLGINNFHLILFCAIIWLFYISDYLLFKIIKKVYAGILCLFDYWFLRCEWWSVHCADEDGGGCGDVLVGVEFIKLLFLEILWWARYTWEYLISMVLCVCMNKMNSKATTPTFKQWYEFKCSFEHIGTKG